MPAGRPRLPDQVKKNKGTLRKDRANPSPPPTTLLLSADPPDNLSKMAKIAWAHIVPELINSKIIATIDIAALTAMCDQLGYFWEIQSVTQKVYAIEDGKIKANYAALKLKKDGRDALKMAISLMSKFGLTPSDRQKIISPGGADSLKDPMEDI